MFEIIRREPRRCDRHNVDFVCDITLFAGREIESLCPACQDALEQAETERERARQRVEFEQAQKRSESRLRKQRLAGSQIPEKYLSRSFANYRAEGEGQQRALEACQRFVARFPELQRSGGGLIMTGRPGTGKTHLACAAGNALLAQGHSVVFLTVARMIRKIRETYRRDSALTEQQVLDALVAVDLLLLDEVGVQRGTESEEQLLFEVLNERNALFAPTVLISNLTAAEIKTFIGERALDRLREGGSKLIVFDWDSYRSRVAGDDNLPGGCGRA